MCAQAIYRLLELVITYLRDAAFLSETPSIACPKYIS